MKRPPGIKPNRDIVREVLIKNGIQVRAHGSEAKRVAIEIEGNMFRVIDLDEAATHSKNKTVARKPLRTLRAKPSFLGGGKRFIQK